METIEQEKIHRVWIMGDIAFTYQTIELEQIQPYTTENKKTFYTAVCKLATIKPKTINFRKLDAKIVEHYAHRILKSSDLVASLEEDGNHVNVEPITKQSKLTPEQKKDIMIFCLIQLGIFTFVFGVSFLLGWIHRLI